MRTMLLVGLTLGACYKEAGVTPCTLTCEDSPCPGALVCGSDMLCQTPGMPLCSTTMGDGSDGSVVVGGIIVKAPNADANDEFGASLALSIDGVWLAVGAPGEASNASGVDGVQTDNSMPEAGAVYVFKWDGTSYVFKSYIKSPSPDAGDRFGASVAFSANSNALVVGAPFEDGNGTNLGGDPANDGTQDSGAVFVFTRTGPLAPWTQTYYVKTSTSVVNTQLGASVAAGTDGLYIAVGAPGALHAGYMDHLSPLGGYGAPVQNVTPSDHVGDSVALARDATTLIVGAELEDSPATGFGGDGTADTAPDAGAVYLATQSGAQQRYCKASNTEAGDQFGIAVAADNLVDVFAVGAIGEDSAAIGADGDQANNAATDAGAVYIFTRAGIASWGQHTYLKAPNTDAGDNFGRSLALAPDGVFLVVGAPGESAHGNMQSDNSAPRSGAVYAFEDGGSGWQPRAYLKAFNNDPGDELGTTVAVSDDHAVIAAGAPHEASGSAAAPNDNTLPNAGAVYVFR